MSMKFKSREGWGGDAEVFDASQKVRPPFSPNTLATVHDYRTKQGRAVLKLVKAAPLLLDALREITDDYADRFDLDDPSTNPGIQSAIEQARAAIAAATN